MRASLTQAHKLQKHKMTYTGEKAQKCNHSFTCMWGLLGLIFSTESLLCFSIYFSGWTFWASGFMTGIPVSQPGAATRWVFAQIRVGTRQNHIWVLGWQGRGIPRAEKGEGWLWGEGGWVVGCGGLWGSLFTLIVTVGPQLGCHTSPRHIIHCLAMPKN